MKRRTLLAVVALLAAGVALGQTSSAPLGARLKLRWQGDKVYLREGDSSHELSK